jgi:Bacterial regulatory proteins, gntR family
VILGDAGRVRTELGRDPGLATQADARTGWAPLHAASASRWHRLDPARAEGLLAVARMLLDAGADPNGRTGEEYGVARLTANKALRLLATEGLAVLSPGMGFYVRTDIGQN